MESAVTSFIHVLNFIIKQLKRIIPYNMLLLQIMEQASDLFLDADLCVEDMRFLQLCNKAKKCSDIMSRFHF